MVAVSVSVGGSERGGSTDLVVYAFVEEHAKRPPINLT